MSQLSSVTSVVPCTLNPTTRRKTRTTFCCSNTNSNTSYTSTQQQAASVRVMKKRTRNRREYPGENKGITEEMRFVAMRLKNTHSEKQQEQVSTTWVPSIQGFLKYLVDSQLVFNTIERIVDQSDDVSHVYFRNTGLERSRSLSNDLEWFAQQNFEIPQSSDPGLQYVNYLEGLAEQSAPLFLSHFYNIYFAHLSGGQVIAKQVSDKLLIERELDYCRLDGDLPEMLKSLRERINMLGEHWSRDEKNKCLREATKSYRFLGQIVRLIIL